MYMDREFQFENENENETDANRQINLQHFTRSLVEMSFECVFYVL